MNLIKNPNSPSDTIDHYIPFNKWDNCSIRGIIKWWLQNFLIERLQFMQAEQNKSDNMNIKCGEPQWLFQVPSQFNMFINDFVKNINCNENCAICLGEQFGATFRTST